MSNRNSNHKPKRYGFPLPVVIRSNSPIEITDGKAQLKHEGAIIIRTADTISVEFEPQETKQGIRQSPESLIQTFFEPSLPNEYVALTKAPPKATSHGRVKSTYEYYKRERDMSFIVLIKRNEKIRKIKLGSLFEPDSIMSKALKEFSREKPFYRRDLKVFRMPEGLKHGQVIKACLDILVHEGFLDRTEITVGKSRKTDRYVRTAKRLP